MKGSILPSRITLGARLCTTQELTTDNQSNITAARKSLEIDLKTQVTAAAVGLQAEHHMKSGSSKDESQNQLAEASRMTIKTQGGNGLLASR